MTSFLHFLPKFLLFYLLEKKLSCLTLHTLKSNDLLCPGSTTSSLINLLKSVRPFIASFLVFSISFLLLFLLFFLLFGFCCGVSEDFLFLFLVDLTNLVSSSLVFFSFFFFFFQVLYLAHHPQFLLSFCFFSFVFGSAMIFYKESNVPVT